MRKSKAGLDNSTCDRVERGRDATHGCLEPYLDEVWRPTANECKETEHGQSRELGPARVVNTESTRVVSMSSTDFALLTS